MAQQPIGRIVALQRARRALERNGLAVRAIQIGPRLKFTVSGYPGSFTPTQIAGLAETRGRL